MVAFNCLGPLHCASGIVPRKRSVRTPLPITLRVKFNDIAGYTWVFACVHSDLWLTYIDGSNRLGINWDSSLQYFVTLSMFVTQRYVSVLCLSFLAIHAPRAMKTDPRKTCAAFISQLHDRGCEHSCCHQGFCLSVDESR